MKTPKSDARNEVIQKFTETIQAFEQYIDEFPYREGFGQRQALTEVLDMFERATAPEEDS